MKNKKGFTLIELLAILVVLSIILIIAVPTVRTLIKKQRRNYYESTDQNVQISVQDYFNSNRDIRPKGAYGRKTVELNQLMDEDYIDQVVDADDKKSCSGYGMIINTGNKNYEYYTCIKCNCNNGTCEYKTDTTKIYKTVVNFCTDDYNPSAKIKTPGRLYLYNGRSDLFDSNKLVGKIYINLNNQDIDWKVSVPATNISDIDINQNKKYILNYSYEDSDNEISLIEASSEFIVYQYKAPKVDPIGFSWGDPIKNELKVKLEPDGILPAGETPPDFKVENYQVSYAVVGTENWSEYKNISCTINSENVCNNGSFDISKLASGNYKLKFRFIDTNSNESLETTGDYTFKIEENVLKCPTIVSNLPKETWTKETVSLTITVNDTFTNWDWNTKINNDAFKNYGKNLKGNKTMSLTDEGHIQGKIVIRNDSGEEKECYTDIYYIDKTAPTCEKVAKVENSTGSDYTDNEWINKSIYTTANCTDTLSGCRSNNLRSVTTSGATTNVTNEFYNSWTVHANGTSSLTWSVYDNVGNKGTCNPINVRKDTVLPEISYTVSGTKTISSSKWYTSNVTINFVFSDNSSGINGNSRKLTENSNTKTLTAVITNSNYKYILTNDSLSSGNSYVVSIEDNAGNIKSLNLSKIYRDATPPVYSNKVTNFSNVYIGQMKSSYPRQYSKLTIKNINCNNGTCKADVNLQENINNGNAVKNTCSSFGEGGTCKSLDFVYDISNGGTSKNFTDVTSGLSTVLVPQPISYWIDQNNPFSDCNTVWRKYTACKAVGYGYFYDKAGNRSNDYLFYEFKLILPTSY